MLLNHADILPEEAEQEAAAGREDPEAGKTQDAAGSTAMTLANEPASSAAVALSPAPAMLQSHLVAVAAQMPTLR